MAGKIAKRPLGAVLDRIIDHRGRTPKKLGGDFALDGVRTLSAKNVKEGRIDLTTEVRYVTREMHNAWMPHKLQIGDVLLTSEAPLGETAYLRDDADFCLGQRLFALRGNPRIITGRYLYYVLRSTQMQQRLHARATGTTAQGIRQSELLKVEVDFHTCIHEQRAIAGILGALDDKIELNRRMNRTLEAIARALFKSWFIDFDPVIDNALRAGHPIPDALADRAHVRKRLLDQRPPLPSAQDFHRLFPDTFTDSDLGPIPEGWGMGLVGDVAQQTLGGKWGADAPTSETVPAICLRGCDMEALRAEGFAPKAPVRHVKPNAIDTRLPSERDVLVAASGAGPCGRPLWCSRHIAQMYSHPVIYSNFVKRLATRSPAHALYLDHVLIRKFYDRSIHDYITGTSVPNLDVLGLLNSCKLVIPPDGVLQAFYDFSSPVLSRLHREENSVLAQLRDTLLPKLLSGEIELPAAEAIAEETCL